MYISLYDALMVKGYLYTVCVYTCRCPFILVTPSGVCHRWHSLLSSCWAEETDRLSIGECTARAEIQHGRRTASCWARGGGTDTRHPSTGCTAGGVVDAVSRLKQLISLTGCTPARPREGCVPYCTDCTVRYGTALTVSVPCTTARH